MRPANISITATLCRKRGYRASGVNRIRFMSRRSCSGTTLCMCRITHRHGSLLRVGQAQPFLGGEKLNLQLGTESAPIRLEVYTRWEEGRWKIYRVRDAGRHYEQPIYNAGEITRARAWSAEIAPEYEKMPK